MTTDMGDKLLAGFESNITLVRIEVKERALDSLQGSGKDASGGGKVGKHDYIIFTVKDSTHSIDFVAEKMRKTVHAAVHSHIRIRARSEVIPSGAGSRFACDFAIPIVLSKAELITTLKEPGRGYGLMTDNCWSYAARTVEAVLNLCKSQSTNNPQATQLCDQALQQLKDKTRPLTRLTSLRSMGSGRR